MSVSENSRNVIGTEPGIIGEAPEPAAAQALPNEAATAADEFIRPIRFATRADAKPMESISKRKVLLLSVCLAVAVLFFAFTALTGKSPKKNGDSARRSITQAQQMAQPPKGSVTPLMDTVHPPATENNNGQLGPGDILRTRSLDALPQIKQGAKRPLAAAATSLGDVPSFADTQQKWEDPAPYNASSVSTSSSVEQNHLTESSLVFVLGLPVSRAVTTPKPESEVDEESRLEMTPGTRIEAKLETQISSAVLAPVVAVVEYTYAISDRIIIPAGARLYGALQQADRSGLVSIKFDELELLDGAREKIDAIGTGIDLGPIKGNVYGKNTGRNFLVRAASGLGSVLAEVAGNNTSAAFSEDDMLRERLAENIGTAGDSEIMNLNTDSRVVVTVPADTKIYVVFTKHEPALPIPHKVTTANP